MPSLEAESLENQQSNDQSKPMSGPIIGIIYPPPEVRSILFQTTKKHFYFKFFAISLLQNLILKFRYC